MLCCRCRRLPTEEKQRLLLTNELYNFFDQSNISKKNVKRLSELEQDEIQEVAHLASVIKRIALLRPGRRRRMPWLRHNEPGLFELALKADLFEFYPTPMEDFETSELDFEGCECVNRELREVGFESQQVERALFCDE